MSKARDSVEDLKTLDANLAAKLPKSGGALTGAVTTNSTFDGVAIATRDGVLTSTTATAAAALPKAGGTMTGDTIHGDNVKAKFGTGGDLEIYHDGSHSRIKDVGTGNLSISASARIGLDASNGDNMGAFNEAGSVQLFHNGSQKLATTSTGVDVTGGLNTTGNVGINNSSPTQRLEINGNSQFNMHDNVSGGGGYFTTKGMQIGNAFDAGLSGGDDDRNAIVWNERGTSLLFGTDNLERMRIDASGNVGIGVVPESHDSNMDSIQLGFGTNLTSWTSSSNTYLMNNSYYNAGWKRINAAKASGYEQDSSGVHKFQVAATGAADSAISWTTAMTIDNSGKVAFSEYNNSPRNGWRIGPRDTTESWSNIAGGSNHVKFYNTNGLVGYIQTSGSATSYSTSSDYRLKTDVQPMTGATATFMQLKPCNFEWIADGTRVDGFLAHELQEVIPAAATGTKDGMMDEEYEVSPATGDVYTAGSDAGFNEVSSAIEASPAYYDVDGNVIKAEVVAVAAVHEAFDSVDEVIHSSDVAQPETLEDGQAWRETTEQVMATRSVPDMQGIDQAKVVPIIVATLQEALARIEALEA